MLIVALETSENVGSVAIARDETMIGERLFEKGLRHGTDVIPTLDELFSAHSLKRSDVGLVAVSTGPGSYTGLRVGIATAKALSFALDAPLVGVPAPDAMIRNLEPEGSAWVLIDARREHLYLSEYRAESGGWTNASEHQVLPTERVAERLKPDITLLGDGVPVLRKFLEGKGSSANDPLSPASRGGEGQSEGPKLNTAAEDAWIPHARFIALLGFQHWRSEPRDERLTVEPLYLRLSEAEETWEKRQSKL